MSAGVLCKEEVLDLINPSSGKAVIDPTSSSELKVAASSLDLPIGMQYWEMAGSCRTGKTLNVRDIIKRYGKPCLLDQQKVLKKNQVYLFEVGCSLDLSAPHARGIEGKATGRSSIGRLDVLARLLIDEGTRFDRVPRNYNKKLYVEVTPFTFDLLVRPGTRLSQLRLFRGYEQLVTLTKEELSHEDDVAFPVVDGSGSPLRQECDMDPHDSWYPLCVDITPDPKIGCVAFVAKDNVSEAVDPDAKEAYDPRDFWEAVYPDESEAKTIQLNPGKLYILRSKERLRIPPHLALECQAYTENMGEWRIEYAGFAHPWFGCQRDDAPGTPIIFEVRGHNIMPLLTDGIPLGNVCFRRMSQPAKQPDEKSDYEKQELKLSSCFKPWPAQGA